MGFRNGFKEWWSFSVRERRAILLLLPLLGALSYIMYRSSEPEFEKSFTAYADAVADNHSVEETSDSISLFAFDPNTVVFHDLCRLGFSRNQALSIIKFRTAGKTFNIPEDFAACYAVSEQAYLRLRPYIKISAAYALKPSKRAYVADTAEIKDTLAPFCFMPDTIGSEGLQREGFSRRQSEVIIKYRKAIGGFRSIEDFGKCYAVSEEMLHKLAPYMIFEQIPKDSTESKIEINSADSAALRSVRGIGEKTVGAIMAYRSRLGGFHSACQIAEIEGVTERNFERICEQIRIDSCKIRKIDINFASAKELEGHPYIPPAKLRKLLKQRQLKGGWHSLEDLLNDKIFTPQEAKNIAPYLIFTN